MSKTVLEQISAAVRRGDTSAVCRLFQDSAQKCDRLEAINAKLLTAIEECASVAELFWQETNSLEKSQRAGKAARSARDVIAKSKP